MINVAVSSAVQRLRAATTQAHAGVDAAFGRHDPSDRAGYARLLLAHARALPAVEAVLAGHDLPAWRERTTLLATDLSELGEAIPDAPGFILPGGAGAAWGALYVTEGSRLGGIMVSRGVPAGLPARYLGAKHRPGEWRALLAAIDAEGERRGAAWVDAAIAGAESTFALYRRAVSGGDSRPSSCRITSAMTEDASG